MAKRRAARAEQQREAEQQAAFEEFSLDETYAGLEGDRSEFGETTGRMIAVMLDGDRAAMDAALAQFSDQAGLRNVCRAADFQTASIDPEQAEEADVIVLEELGMAILNGAPEQNARMMAAASSGAMADRAQMIVEPETYKYTQGWEVPPEQQDLELDQELPAQPLPGFPIPAYPAMPFDPFLMGYLSGVQAVASGLAARPAFAVPGLPPQLASAAKGISAAAIHDSGAATWGLIATGVAGSPLSGRGIRVAVLDTGFDAGHPDFENRAITRQSFIPAQIEDQFGRVRDVVDRTPDDISGHGTHVAGTACGPRHSRFGRRYGIAFDCEIFIAKVLSVDLGRPGSAGGRDGDILEGLNWALANGCQIVNMSLGAPATSASFEQRWENAARRALSRGQLIIAATGNDSAPRPSLQRLNPPRPVGHPANCPSIVGVAAVDQNLRVAAFSNAQRFTTGGEVNFAGPGTNVLSARPRRLGSIGRLQGTSMATPHVSGIAALIAQEAGLRGLPLYREIRRRVGPLSDSRRDVGNGVARV